VIHLKAIEGNIKNVGWLTWCSSQVAFRLSHIVGAMEVVGRRAANIRSQGSGGVY
jgi:hypothetical protein